MKIHPLIAAGIVTLIVSLQTWTLTKVTALSEDVAVLKVKVSMLNPQLSRQ